MNKPVIKLSANENYYGCAPEVTEVLRKNCTSITAYPDFHQNELKTALASKAGLRSENVMLGVGTVYIIDAIIRLLCGPEEEILTYERSFVAYGQLSKQYGRKCFFAPLENFGCTAKNILSLVTSNTKVIFIANPNNPTGTIMGKEEAEFLLRNVPSHVYVVFDEAYNEYVLDRSFPEMTDYIKTYPNLIVLRGLSKVHGLAGLRIGYGYASENTAAFIEQRRLPYSINSLSSAAAITALQATEFTDTCAMLNAREREYLFTSFSSLGYNTTRSFANYIFLYFENEEDKMRLLNELAQDGIIACNLEVFGQSNSLRIGVADREVNERIIKCAEKAMPRTGKFA